MSNWPFGALKEFSYTLIMADPPWPYELRSEKGESKSYAKHYGAMSLRDIAALPVGHLVRGDCLLWLWAISPMVPHAIWVMSEWGFTWTGLMQWRKVTRRGRPRMGTGYRIRSMSEPVLLGSIGSPKHKAFLSSFDGIAREHSRKPDEAFELCERCMPDAFRVELFSRQSRPGWDTWGLEAGKFDPVVTLNAPVRDAA